MSSDKVRDEALEKAYEIVSLMLAKRPDVKQYMVSKGCHVMIIGEHEEVCDLPEYAHICNTPENIVSGISVPEVLAVLRKMIFGQLWRRECAGFPG